MPSPARSCPKATVPGRKIGFLSYHGSASTISERINGYTDALKDHGLRPLMDSGHVDFEDDKRPTWKGRAKFDSLEAFVCVNDRLAGQLMHIFLARKLRIPEDIRSRLQ